MDHSAHAHGDTAHPHGETKTATDPVCGMKVDPAKSKHRHAHGGQEYVFCSAGCLGKFAADPERYLGQQTAKPAPPAPEGTIYTCPMHPEIRQVGPGSCPICGMALEPVGVSVESGPSAELIDMTRRFWIGAVLAIADRDPGNGRTFPGPEPAPLCPAASLDLDSVRARHAGRAVGRLAVLRARLGVGAQPLAEHVQPDRARHRRRLSLQPGRHLRARAFPGRVLRHGRRGRRSTSKPPPSSPCWCCSARCWNCARASRPAAPSARCSNLAPKTARRVRDDGNDEEVPLEQVHIGDRLRVRPGDSVPVDGVVARGPQRGR